MAKIVDSATAHLFCPTTEMRGK